MRPAMISRLMLDCRIEVELELGAHLPLLSLSALSWYACSRNHFTAIWVHMQILPGTDVADFLDRLVADELPGRRGLEAWRAMMTAHATLIRRRDTELGRPTGLALAQLDVVARVAAATGACGWPG